MTAIILSYHRIAEPEMDPWGLRVSRDRFDAQLTALKEIGQLVSLSSLLTGDPAADPGLRMALTFDDGYCDNYHTALPLLRRHAVPATIFVASGFIGKPYFWWDVLDHVFLRPNNLPLDLILDGENAALNWSLGQAACYSPAQYERDCLEVVWRGENCSRVRLYHDVYDALWPLPHANRLEQVAALLTWAGAEVPSMDAARPMSRDELADAAREPLVTIGCHTMNHLRLDVLPERMQRDEIQGSLRMLEQIANSRIETFAFPHGKYNADTLRILRTLGFRFACTTRQASVGDADDPLLLPRIEVGNWRPEVLLDRIQSFCGQG